MNKQSLQSIFTLSNGMIGSAPIVLPVLYNNYGLLNGFIYSTIICLTSVTTCLIIQRLHQKEEIDLQFMINRLLGLKQAQSFNFVSVIYLIACAQINMIIACSLIYPVISNFIKNSAPQNEFTFNQFSYQILGIIYGLILFPTFLIKNISPLMKFPAYGSIATFSSIIYLIYRGAQTTTITNYYTSDFTILPSVFSLAFLGHTLVVPILHNMEKKRNTKEIILAYLITYILYQLIGYFGSCALYNRQVQTGLQGNTILEYFPQSDYLVVTLQVLIFIQVSSLFPIIQFFSRLRFMKLIKQESKGWIYSIIFTAICIGFEMLNVDLTLLIAYTGAIIGFIVAYLIPVSFEINEKRQNHLQVQLIENEDENKKSGRRVLDYIKWSLLMSIGSTILICRFL